jgi:CheY-like chemotaxis protein
MTASVTADADEALSWLRSGRCFDVAVVGHNSTGPAGPLIEALVTAQTAAPLPVVVSAYGTAGPALRAEAFTCAGLLPKPLRQSSLGSALGTVLRTGTMPDVERSRPAGPAAPSDLRILVVDDHDLNRHAADLLLHSLGHEAVIVASGPEAIEAVARERFDLVLMDLAMPGIDGITATREIRRQGTAVHQPQIVALTAATLPEDRHACLRAGMDGILTKPIDRGELVQVLARASAGRLRYGSRPVVPAVTLEARPDHDDSVLREVAAQFGSAAAREFVDMFRRGPASAPQDIAAALAARRTEEALRLAHTLKSSARLVGATALARCGEEVETLLQQNNAAAAAAAAAALPRVMAQTLRWLEASPYGREA